MINYESPLFVSIVLFTLYAMLLVALGLTVWSVVRSLRRRERDEGALGGVSQWKIVAATVLFLVLTMGVAWLLASTKPLHVNGKVYDDSFWLRVSDVLIITPAVLVVVIMLLMGVAEIVRRRNSHV